MTGFPDHVFFLTAVPVVPMPQGDGNAPESCAACEASTDPGAPTTS